MSKPRCIETVHPHPGRNCRDPRDVYRNRWGAAPAQPPVDEVPGQTVLEVPDAD